MAAIGSAGSPKQHPEKRGAKPKADIEHSEDQISAVAQVVEGGFVPYADFALFGKHGKRMVAKLQYIAFVSLPDGTWQRRELPGPPSYSAWYAAWRVYRTTVAAGDRD